MLKRSIGTVLVGVALASAGSAANAQSVDGGGVSCEVILFSQQAGVTARYNRCIASQTSRMRTLYVPSVVERAVGNSFGFLTGPRGVEPAGLSDIVAGEADERLSASEIAVVPAADDAVAQSANWNVWSDGRYLYSDYAASVGDFDGPTWSGMAGADYKLTQSITLGVLMSADSTKLENALSDSNSSSLGIGPYVGIVLTDNIVFSSNVLASWVDADQIGGLLQFKSERIQASAGLTGYWYSGTWRFSPGVTVSWSKEWEDETSAFMRPDRIIEVAVLTPGLQIGNTMRLSDTTTVEPWLGASLDWTFLNEIHTSGFGTTSDPNTDLRLEAGLNFSFGTNAQLAITGEMSGLLLDDLNAYSVAANLAFQL